MPAVAVARDLLAVLKLRIGLAIALAAIGGLVLSPAPLPSLRDVALLALGVLLAAASAGAYNHIYELDLDARMPRTRTRPFATGRFRVGPRWYLFILLLLLAGVGLAAYAGGGLAALFVFMGAFTYGVVYTVWLKRRTAWNIVVGGLAGSFAVLAGAAAVDPAIGASPLVLAFVLFLWTPPHFWSLAMAVREDYARAGVPMLPVVVGEALCARVIFVHTVALVLLSLIPALLGAGVVYLVAALLGGGWFLYRSMKLAEAPERRRALSTFFASLVQLTLLITGAALDRWLVGGGT